MKTLDELLKEQKSILKSLSEITNEINNRKSETIILCENKDCGRGFRVKDVSYTQIHKYIKPYGCSDGDYWDLAEGVFICPVCEYRNRLYNKPDIVELKYHFKDIIDEYLRS